MHVTNKHIAGGRTALPPEKAETTNLMVIMTEKKKDGMNFQKFKK